MLKSVAKRPWVCSRCVRKTPPIRYRHSQAVPLTEGGDTLRFGTQSSKANHEPAGTLHDDRTLRQIFDSPGFWREFSQSSKSGKKVGLFQNRYLTEPKGFEDFAKSTLKKAKKIVQRVLAASTPEQYYNVVKDLDRLSDLLCRVIDLSDFVRATHPDPSIQAAATNSYGMMFEYMNVLNTTTGLAEQLDVAIQVSRGSGRWGEQETMVADILKRDFAKSAIDLPQAERERFVTLSQEISEIGSEFVEHMAPKRSYLTFQSSQMKGMDPMLVREFTKWGKVTLPSVGGPSVAALRSVHDEEVRKQIYKASRTADSPTIARLDALVRKRAELARLSKFESYAQMTLEDKMAGSPRSAEGFLYALCQDNRPGAMAISSELLKAKLENPNALSPILQSWDKDYYMSHILSKVRSKTRNPDFLASYFSLGRVMQGLSRLFSRLYGIRFVPHETRPGETWNSDVRRLDVISETDGHVAVLYCDLFSRVGKSPNPAHFTLRCSRLIREDELQEALQMNSPLFSTAEEAANDGMSTSQTAGGVMQLPTIALICDFETNPGSSQPALLSFSELTTLFHEMGHAIHSILGRTAFQNVSGTRCATDFAELPSVLMEHFAADPKVLSLFATHYETDEPLPYEMVAEKLAVDRRFEAADLENQVILSLVDQQYHSGLLLSQPSVDITSLYHMTQMSMGALPADPLDTCWQGFFGHLYGYGATYYSYLFDRVLARRVWREVFEDGKDGGGIKRENGDRMMQGVLRHGGARDPWKCLSDVLKDDRVSEGGEDAMTLVGDWGVEGRQKEKL